MGHEIVTLYWYIVTDCVLLFGQTYRFSYVVNATKSNCEILTLNTNVKLSGKSKTNLRVREIK